MSIFYIYTSSYVITLLSAPDTEFLIQLIRFLNTILLRTNANNNPWLSLIEKNDEQFFNQIDHLFSNSLNNELLKALFRYINDLLYKNNDLGNLFNLFCFKFKKKTFKISQESTGAKVPGLNRYVVPFPIY